MKAEAADVSDARDHNTIEDRNGNDKRRHGLELITEKLDETAKIKAARNLLAMNTVYKLAGILLYLLDCVRLEYWLGGILLVECVFQQTLII